MSENKKNINFGNILDRSFLNKYSLGTPVSGIETLQENLRSAPITNFRTLLSDAYVEIGLIKTIVDIPVEDSLRGGIDIFSSDLSPEDIEILQSEILKNRDLIEFGLALKWKRLFGGSGIIFSTEEDPSEPFELSKIKKDQFVEFKSADLWELFSSNLSIGDSTFTTELNKRKKDYKIDSSFQYFNYYNNKVHRSRVITFMGEKPPSLIRPKFIGWGYSVVEHLVRSLNQYLKSTNLVFEVLDEFKIDIFKIQGLSDALINDNDELIYKRIQTASREKNYNSSLTMDNEDDYQQKQLSFSGIAEVMEGVERYIASAMRMPITKLFGVSSAGFNSGDDDIENYNGMIESSLRTTHKCDLLDIVKIRCQTTFGFIPPDLKIEFKPLKVLSEKENEEIKSIKFNRLLQARQAGEISPIDFKRGCNKDQLFPVAVEENEDTFAMESFGEDKKIGF